jgi:carboxymethylenebutenolidase
MCDESTVKDNEKFLAESGRLSRREFSGLAAGAALTFLLPRAADALDVVEADVDVTTPDGTADCYFVHPAAGRHPGVIIWPDILGLRPAFRQMGKRLAESGYAVLVVNPYYRAAKAPVVPEGATFQDPATRETVMPLARQLNAKTHVTDARALVKFIDQQGAVDTGHKLGTTGYCMGGPIVFRTAAAVPDRVGAAATFHGGGLVTDDPDSPHLLIPQMKAQFLIAIAANDDEKQPDAKDTLRASFEGASLPAEIEVYEGTLHGWCPPDSSVYNEEQAERAWSRLLALFKAALA